MRGIAINVGGAHLHPYRRRAVDAADGHAQNARCLHPRTEDFILMVGGLDAIDATSHQVDQAARAIQLPLPLSQAPGIPRHMPPWSLRYRWLTRKQDDRPAQVCQVRSERYS